MHGALQTRPVAPGFFLTFEGGEGAGKSTQLARLADHLRDCGLEVVTTREPGGTDKAEKLRDFLLSGRAAPLGPLAEAALFSAARADHVEKLLDGVAVPQSREELQARVGLVDRKHFREVLLNPLLAAGWVEMTIPNVRQSRLQKYRLTAKGRAWLVNQSKRS